MIKRIFICGCPRSGTTYFAKVLGSNTGYQVIPEIQYKYDLFVYLSSNEQYIADRINEIIAKYEMRTGLKYGQISDYEILNLGPFEVYQLIYERSLTLLGFDKNVPLIDHTPSNALLIDFQQKSLLESRHIGIVRDPRAIYNSLRKLPWGPNSPKEFCIYFLSYYAAMLDWDIMLCKYEDLLIDEWDCISSLGLDTIMTEKSSSCFEVPDYTKDQHILVNGPPILERIDAWKKSLTTYEQKYLANRLYIFMLPKGYNVVIREISILDKVAHIIKRFSTRF